MARWPRELAWVARLDNRDLLRGSSRAIGKASNRPSTGLQRESLTLTRKISYHAIDPAETTIMDATPLEWCFPILHRVGALVSLLKQRPILTHHPKHVFVTASAG